MLGSNSVIGVGINKKCCMEITARYFLCGVGHKVKDHSDSERRNPLPPHGLLFPISSKGYFISTIPQTG